MQKIQLVSILLLSFLFGLNTSLAGVLEDKATIKAVLAKQMPDLKLTGVNETSVPGMYEVIMPPRIFYVSADAKYLITGDMIQISSGDNITSPQRDKARADAVELLGEDSMIVYAPRQVKHTITVFTDIDCGYCRKLHNEMAEYNIDINAIAPGAVNTRLLDQTLAAGEAAGKDFLAKAIKQKQEGVVPPVKIAELAMFLASPESDGLSGRIISLIWDDWKSNPEHFDEIMTSDIYTLRRIIPADRGYKW